MYYRGVCLELLRNKILTKTGEFYLNKILIEKIDANVDLVYQKGMIVFAEDKGFVDNIVITLMVIPLQKKVFFYNPLGGVVVFILSYKFVRVSIWRTIKVIKKYLLLLCKYSVE